MVRYDVARFAGRASDKDGAMVVAVLGDTMTGPVETGFAGEAQLI